MEKIDVVIVTWNSPTRLRACLESLKPHGAHVRNTYVIDNGDEVDRQASEVVLDVWPSGWVVDQLGANMGFPEGVNIGVDRAKRDGADWVVLLNDDTVVGKNFGACLQWTAGRSHPQFAMAQAPLAYAHDPERVASLGLKLTDRASGEDLHEGQFWDRGAPATSPMVGLFCPTAGAAMYKVSALEEARMSFGIMDPRHFLYYEDLDLGWRLRLLGYEPWTMLGMEPVRHFVSQSVMRHPKKWIRAMQERNRVRTFIRNASDAWIDRCLFRVVEDAEDAAREEGQKALHELAKAVTEAWVDRRELDGKLRPGARETLEGRVFG